MKKNSLVFSMLLLMGALSFSACDNDEATSKSLKGRYTAQVTNINLKELADASKEAQVELEKGKKELHDNLEKAQKELDKEVNIEIDGKKVELKEAMGELGQGLEKIMDGLGDMGNGFSKGITELVIKNTKFQVDFRDDGVLAIGSDNEKFNMSSKNLTWEVQDGKLIIQDKDKNKESFIFELKAKNDTEYELISDKITLLLSKTK